MTSNVCFICFKPETDSYSYTLCSKVHYDCVLKELEKGNEALKLVAREWKLEEAEADVCIIGIKS